MTDRQALKLGRRIVRYTLAMRPEHRRDCIPLTAGWIMRISRRIGTPVGRDRAYHVQRALVEAHEIKPAGSYPHRRAGRFTGFKVKLWAPVARLRQNESSVPGRRRATSWWTHPLFGFGQRSYPRGLPRRLRDWKEVPEWHRGVPMIFSQRA